MFSFGKECEEAGHIEGVLNVYIKGSKLKYDVVLEPDSEGLERTLTESQKIMLGLCQSARCISEYNWVGASSYMGLAITCLSGEKISAEDYPACSLKIEKFLQSIKYINFIKEQQIKLLDYYGEMAGLAAVMNLPRIAKVAQLCKNNIINFFIRERDAYEKHLQAEQLKQQTIIENNKRAEINKNIREAEKRDREKRKKLNKSAKKKECLGQLTAQNNVPVMDESASEQKISVDQTQAIALTQFTPLASHQEFKQNAQECFSKPVISTDVHAPIQQLWARSIFYPASTFSSPHENALFQPVQAQETAKVGNSSP